MVFQASWLQCQSCQENLIRISALSQKCRAFQVIIGIKPSLVGQQKSEQCGLLLNTLGAPPQASYGGGVVGSHAINKDAR